MGTNGKFPAWAGILFAVLIAAVIVEGYFLYRSFNRRPPAMISPARRSARPAPLPLDYPAYPRSRRRYRTPAGWDGNLFREMERMQARINHLFESAFSGGWFSSVPGEDYLLDLDIRADMRETEGEIIVTCDLPGMDKEGIDLRIEGGNLIISGERKIDRREEEKGAYREERSYGSFERVISLPAEVDDAGIEATYEKGVLTVRLPKLKPSPVKSKRITVI